MSSEKDEMCPGNSFNKQNEFGKSRVINRSTLESVN